MTSRRDFLKAALAAGALGAAGGCLSRGFAANSRVRLAAIGIGQQGWADMQEFMKCADLCEFVALCDTDLESDATLPALKAFPELPRYRDFREMFDREERNIDAVLIATPDHSHFCAAIAAMKLGKAVFVEKPLAHSFAECRLMMEAAKRYRVVTQMGNQGHSTIKYHQFKEYVAKGVVKDVELARVHMNFSRRWHKYAGNVFAFPAERPVPPTLDWDAWLGPAQHHNYSPEYERGEWRCWYDFGNGCLGDWGAHTMDCMHEFLLKGDLPTKVELLKCEGWNQFIFPCATTLAFTFPANAKHGDFRLEWYDGAANLPELPRGYVYEKDDGSIPANSANDPNDHPTLLPGKEMYQRDGTVWQSRSHCHPLHRVGDFDGPLPDYPPETETHYRNFLRAVIGETKATSPFSVAGPLSQLFTLGVIAQRLNRSFEFDPAAGRAPHDEYADFFLAGPPPRRGWEDFYRVS